MLIDDIQRVVRIIKGVDTVKKHFVTFYSPGTFVAEETTQEIDAWDVNVAIGMSKSITERYNAKPYGFQFSTRERGEQDLDSCVVKTSGMYYLGGEVLTLKQVKAQMPDEDILISNMQSNGWRRVIVNKNSWGWTMPLCRGDVVLKVG